MNEYAVRMSKSSASRERKFWGAACSCRQPTGNNLHTQLEVTTIPSLGRLPRLAGWQPALPKGCETCALRRGDTWCKFFAVLRIAYVPA